MSWWDGKDKLVVLSIGDSNSGAIATPTNTAPNLQTHVAANKFWARDGSLPYVAGTQTWRSLDQDGTSRLDERESANGDNSVPGTLYCGQVLGGHGCPAMALASSLYAGTALPIYTFGGYMGGAVSADWTGYLWTQLETAITAALAAIPATAADVIHLSMGGADLLIGTTWWTDFLLLTGGSDWHQPFTSPTAQEYYENMLAFRANMVDAGWWVPGVTQIYLGDIPRSGYTPFAAYPAWQGIEYVRARFNDRITLINSVDATYDPAFPIHYSPESYTQFGNEASVQIVDQIPTQRAVFSVGGSRLSVGGSKLRVNAA